MPETHTLPTFEPAKHEYILEYFLSLELFTAIVVIFGAPVNA